MGKGTIPGRFRDILLVERYISFIVRTCIALAASFLLLSSSPRTGAQLIATDTITVDMPGKTYPSRRAKTITEVLPQRLIDIMNAAESTECVVLCAPYSGGRPRCNGGQKDRLLYPEEIQARRRLEPEEAAQVKVLLCDAGNYLVYQNPNEQKACVRHNDVAYLLSWSRNMAYSERVVILICHGCAQMSVVWRRNRLDLEVDYMAERLLELSRSFFPTDSTIAEIYRRRHGTYDKPR